MCVFVGTTSETPAPLFPYHTVLNFSISNTFLIISIFYLLRIHFIRRSLTEGGFLQSPANRKPGGSFCWSHPTGRSLDWSGKGSNSDNSKVPWGFSDIPGGQHVAPLPTPAAPRKIFSSSAVRRTALRGEVTQVGFIPRHTGKKSQPKLS